MSHQRKYFNLFAIFCMCVCVGIYAGCDKKSSTEPEDTCPDLGTTPTKSSEWVGFVNWDEATRVELSGHEVSSASYKFNPAKLEFVAGKPYILVLKTETGNTAKHYFHAPEFYKAIATRKAQTIHGEYKAAYFDDFELKTGANELELYFVPVKAGAYNLVCTIAGHQDLGMEAVMTITCGTGLSLDLEVDPSFTTALGSDPRRSDSHAVWTTAEEVTLTMVETSATDYSFSPDTLTLTAGNAYKLKIVNPEGNSSKHYYTAYEFYKTLVTRKAEDSEAEIKVPYFKAVELLIGGTTELFIVPTKTGVYSSVCTVDGHIEAGMTGTVIVQ